MSITIFNFYKGKSKDDSESFTRKYISNKCNYSNPLSRKYISSWFPKGHPKGMRILDSFSRKYISSWFPKGHPKGMRILDSFSRKYISSWFPKGHPKGMRILESNKCNFTNPLSRKLFQINVILQILMVPRGSPIRGENSRILFKKIYFN